MLLLLCHYGLFITDNYGQFKQCTNIGQNKLLLPFIVLNTDFFTFVYMHLSVDSAMLKNEINILAYYFIELLLNF